MLLCAAACNTSTLAPAAAGAVSTHHDMPAAAGPSQLIAKIALLALKELPLVYSTGC